MKEKTFSALQLFAAFVLGGILAAGIATITATPTEVVKTEFITVTKEVPVKVEKKEYIFLPQEMEFSHMEIYGDYIAVYYSYMGEMHRHDYYGDVFDMRIEDDSVEESDSNPNMFTLTAYCACELCCGEYANGYTATGTLATANRTIAVDPKVIPYGTHVLINGKEYIAEDCGGAINGNRIDIYFDTHQEALNFGRQTAEVTILN